MYSSCFLKKKKKKNWSKIRKLLAEARVVLTSEEIQSVRLFDKVCCSTPTLQTQQAVICDSIEIDLNDSLNKKCALIIWGMRT